MKIITKITNGKFSDIAKKTMIASLREYEGEVVTVEVKKKETTRSINQNKYRWGVVVKLIMQHLNEKLEHEGCNYRMTKDDADCFMKEHLLGIVQRIPIRVNGGVIELVVQGKLKTRSTKDFEEAMEMARAKAATLLGLEIPLPNEDCFEGNPGKQMKTVSQSKFIETINQIIRKKDLFEKVHIEEKNNEKLFKLKDGKVVGKIDKGVYFVQS